MRPMSRRALLRAAARRRQRLASSARPTARCAPSTAFCAEGPSPALVLCDRHTLARSGDSEAAALLHGHDQMGLCRIRCAAPTHRRSTATVSPALLRHARRSVARAQVCRSLRPPQPRHRQVRGRPQLRAVPARCRRRDRRCVAHLRRPLGPVASRHHVAGACVSFAVRAVRSVGRSVRLRSGSLAGSCHGNCGRV